MPVKIHNKDYKTVAERIAEFQTENRTQAAKSIEAELPGSMYGIETRLISQDDEKVIMKALIMDGERILSTGYAEEVRGSSNINQTSALENAETSAVGRALAFFGYAGTEIASADEVAAAITQQREKELYAQFALHMQAVTEHYESLAGLRFYLSEGPPNYSAAREAWNEIPQEHQKILWRAPTKGGWLATEERRQMKSNEWNEA